jgi:LuxR family transcriptional regulator, maltose regulon positive regulatory protein
LPAPILKTKLFIPPSRPGVVSRPRLYDRLSEGLKPGCPLILISAPPGFGKTVLLSDWISQVSLPTAWLSLDEGDNEALRFWRHLIAALQTIQAASEETMQLALEAVQAPPREVFIPALLNDLAQIDAPALLVLDDYHLVENVGIHGDINFLLNLLPPQFHIVVTTRSDPPLQIARRRGDMGLVEIRASDLRFSPEETISFLNDTMKLGLSPDDVQALEIRTEGWIVGLQMAALSLQGRSDKHSFITSFTGDDRFITDYLLEEVLQRQPANIQSFLLRTSILKRLNASLCDAILESQIPEPKPAKPIDPDAGRNISVNSGQEILEYLERSNLFIVPLDNRREWFRYHHLFTRLLTQRFLRTQGDLEIQAIQKKARQWFETNGLLPEAVEYALACNDYENATRLISMVGELMFVRSEFNTVLLWADKLPVELLLKQPALCTMFAWAALATGHPQQTELYLGLIEKSIGATIDACLADHPGFAALPPLTRSALYDVAVIRARVAIDQFDTRRTYDIARLVMPFLTLEQNKQPFLFNLPYNLRSPLLQTMALAYKIDGDLEKARRHFSDALDLAIEVDNIYIIAICMSEIGQILILQGHLKEAQAAFQKTLRYSEKLGERISIYFSRSIIGLGNLAYEWNDLEASKRYLLEGVKLARIWNSWEALVPGYLGTARLMATQGHWEAAYTALDDLEETIKNLAPSLLISVDAYRTRLYLAQGNIVQAIGWAKSVRLDSESEINEKYEAEYFLLARLFYAQGESKRCINLLERLRGLAEAGERGGRAIQIRALQAVVLEACGLSDEAAGMLLPALRLAAPQGYLRTFLDEGQPMENLLINLRDRKKIAPEDSDLSTYLQALLTAFDDEKVGVYNAQKVQETIVQPISTPQVSAAEPLSKREQDVLHLMADGASNIEIARKLFLSVNTVKKHVSNIFSKLGAASRTQAVERGRRLGYLQA